jgi:hypothetical protein
MRLLFYTDLHAADQTPRSRTGDYAEDMLAKLKEIITLAVKYDVDYLVNGADTFDRKSPWRVSHRLVNEMSSIMSGFPGNRHLTVIGTHDVPTGRLDKLPQQPLESLQRAGVITVLEPHKLKNGLVRYPAMKNSAVPESEHEFMLFHPVPASYDLDKDPANYALITPEDWRCSMAPLEDEDGDFNTEFSPDDTRVTIAHGMVVPPGRSFFGDFTDAHDITKLTKAHWFLYGHPHTPDGVYLTDPDRVEFTGPTFVGPGSVSRRDSSPYNRKRIPQVVLLETTNIASPPKVKMIDLESARPPGEVFAETIADEEDENARDERVEAFVRSLSSASIKDDSWGTDQLLEEIRSMDSPEEVRQVAEQILEEVAK